MNINWHLRELNLKVVYYGPALSGKTTNIQQIHDRVDPQHRSELVTLKTHEDRTLFFDFLQLELGKISGLTPKIHLYTVPGQTYYEASRKVVLRNVDGVVFVADSDPARMEANKIAWEDLQKHLEAFHLSLNTIPVVIQCNKQDIEGAMSAQTIRDELRTNGFPLINAAARSGEGVFDTLKLITKGVITAVQQQMG